jgi:short-subunit dehydrogenase
VCQQIRADGGEAESIVADLALEAGRVRVLDRAVAAGEAVDVLVNNAGFGWYGFAEEMPWTVARQMIDVNIAAVTHLTLRVLAEMKARGHGHIINVGSVAGDIGAQGVALYSGTKSFLRSFTRSLQRETRGTGVRVSLLQVGIVTGTEFYSSIRSQPGALRIPAGAAGAAPERVAERVVALLQRPRQVTYVPRIARAAVLVEPLLWWALDLAGALHLRRAATAASEASVLSRQ